MTEQNQSPEIDPLDQILEDDAAAEAAGPAEDPYGWLEGASVEELREYLKSLHEAFEAEQEKARRLQVKAAVYAQRAAKAEENLLDRDIADGAIKFKAG